MTSETNDQGDRKLGSTGRTLGVRKTTVEQGRVRQSFSHGRTKTVVVETKRKRAPGPGRPEAAAQPESKPAVATPAPATNAAPRNSRCAG